MAMTRKEISKRHYEKVKNDPEYKAKRDARVRKWMAEHKEQRQEYMHTYYVEHPVDPEVSREARKKFYWAHRDDVLDKMKERNERHCRRDLAPDLDKSCELHHFSYEFKNSVIVMTRAGHREMHRHLERVGKTFKIKSIGVIIDDLDSALVFAQQFDPNSYTITKETK